MKFTLISLGCPKNTVDGLNIITTLERAGYSFSPDVSECELAVVNTCGFIESAKRESIEQILEVCELKAESDNPLSTIAVCGCLAERYFDEIKRDLPEVDIICGLGAELPALLRTNTSEKGSVYDLPLGYIPQKIYSPSAYLKIAEGCSNRCTYCAIPSIRGDYRSRAREDVLREARELAAGGVVELTLVAQDTTAYDDTNARAQGAGESGYRLPELLREICLIDGIQKVYILYAYPERITDELIEVIKTEPKIAKYLDLPVQHICDDILHKMKRQSTSETVLRVIKKLREIPSMTLRTTLIAGFPSETEEQFSELCRFVREARFEHLGAFAYSQEEGTPAAELPEQLSEEVKAQRAEAIESIQSVVFEEKLLARVGKVERVLVEGFDKYAEVFFGRSDFDAPEIDGRIFFSSTRDLTVGEYVDVKLTEIIDFDIYGTCGEQFVQNAN